MKQMRVPGLFLAQMTLAVAATIGFKLSASSTRWTGFWFWQVLGNLAGFGGVLALTGLLRLIPMHVAFPISEGLAVIGVQVVAARLIFGETIQPSQWLGTLLVVGGIVLVSARR